MAEVELRAVRKVYPGGVEAVKGVDLAIEDGNLCVLVGPSGCGKSTLLRMIAGLETVSDGEIAIDGRVVNRLEPAERDIAMVFQNYALYPHMTVYDNMAYGLRNRGFGKDDIENKVREAARILAIGEFLNRRPRQLSGGQRQRVAMGRAIVRDPKVFLFDEPLSNLDAKLRVQMRIEIRRLQESLGTTSVYVTHDQLEAMTLADMLVVMNGGRIEQIGRPMDVYERPLTPFVAAFIGSPSMNLLPAVANGDGARLSGQDGAPVTPPLDHAGEVLVGVRPEHIALGKPPRGTGFKLDLEVAAIEPVGSESFVHGRMGNGELVVVRVAGKANLAPGDTVTAHAPAQALHLFAAETGRRIEPRAAAA